MTDLDSLTDAWERLAPGPAPVQEMLRTHHARQARRRRRRLAVVSSVAAVAVVAVSLTVQAQRTSPDPARPAPSPAAPTPAPTADTAPATPPAVPAPDDRSTVYFVLEGSGLPAVGVIPMRLRTGRGEPVVRALEALFTAQPPRQTGFAGTGNPWLGEEGEPRATLRSVDRGDGLVVVDLDTISDSLRTGLAPDLGLGGQLPLLQVACTAQHALDTADPVRITLRGEPVRLFSRDASRPRVCPEQLLTGSVRGPRAG